MPLACIMSLRNNIKATAPSVSQPGPLPPTKQLSISIKDLTEPFLRFPGADMEYRKEFGFLSSFCSGFALMSYTTGITGTRRLLPAMC